MYINKAMMYGNLARNPKLRAFPSGGSVCSFYLTTIGNCKKSDGSKAEETQFHNRVVFGKPAESSAQFLGKGTRHSLKVGYKPDVGQ